MKNSVLIPLIRTPQTLFFRIFCGLQIPDGTGRECKMALWRHPGSDVTGMVARCEKVVDTSEKVVGH